MSKKILLTSVCRPMGPKYGDAPSVGYELLYRQVLRAQGIFSPRTVNIHFGLEYIAENLDAPTCGNPGALLRGGVQRLTSTPSIREAQVAQEISHELTANGCPS